MVAATDVSYPLYENDLKEEKDINNNESDLDPKIQLSNGHKPAATGLAETVYTPIPYKKYIVWPKLIFTIAFHILAIMGLLQLPFIKLSTLYFTIVAALSTTVGIQAGVHRLWAHRAYKATFPLRLFIMLANTMAFQTSIYEWSRDHRGHHKWSDTDADPYNANRGFIFSHIGWIVINKHPEVIRKGKTIDMSDLEADPIVMFQKKYYLPLVFIFWGLIPTYIPVLCFGESAWKAMLTCVFFRHVYTLHVTWLVNSWAHMFGYRPYDKRIAPVEASIRHLLMGEGFHNYHHAFPWDYSASELGPLDVYNPATAFIDVCAKMGLAYDLKRANSSLIAQRLNRYGEGKGRRYEGVNVVGEWIGGVVTLVAPFLLLRWSVAACYGILL